MASICSMNGVNPAELLVSKPGQQPRQFGKQGVTVINGQQGSPDVKLNVRNQRLIDELLVLLVT